MARRCPLLALALLLVLTGTARAACFDSDEAFLTWVENYGPAPDPARLGCAMDYLANSKLFSAKPMRRPLAYFFGAALFRAPRLERDRAVQTVQAAPNQAARIVLLNSVWYADCPESRALLGQLRSAWTAPHEAGLIQGMLADPPRPLLGNTTPADRDELEQAAKDLDCLWMRYLATNDPAHVERIFQTACLSLSSEDEGAGLLGIAARWSLRANLKVPRIRALLEQRLTTATGLEWAVLDDVLHGKAAQPPAAK